MKNFEKYLNERIAHFKKEDPETKQMKKEVTDMLFKKLKKYNSKLSYGRVYQQVEDILENLL